MPAADIALKLTGVPGWTDGQGRCGALARKDAALLAVLAWDGPSPRDRLAALLWPASSPTQAHASLRQRLYRLRRDIGCDLALNQAQVSLASGVSHDLQSANADSDELLGLQDYGDLPALDEWVTRARQQWRARRVDTLTGLAAQREADGAWAAAIVHTDRILSLQPLQEHAWRRLMRLHYLRGDRAAAIATFERFEQLLRHEQGSRPSAETIEQLRQIENADAAPPARRRVLPPQLVRPPRVVGREQAYSAMARAWDAGRAFVLEGQAGLGKSRLLDDFLANEAFTGLQVLRAQGRPGDERSPYALVMRLLRPALQPVPLEVLSTLAPVDRRELARLWPALGDAPSAPGNQAAMWHAIEQLLVGLHRACPLVLVADDLQFADDASIELLRWLAPAITRQGLHLALATRPADGPQRRAVLADWWSDSGRPEPIGLTALDMHAVADLLASLNLPDLGPERAPDLLRHAGGEPFHLLETLKDLALHGAPAPGRWPRPATVTTLLARRLATLSPAARDLVRLAGVADADLTAARAARILARSPLSLITPWSELQAQGVLDGERFCHDLMRDAALADVPAAMRTLLHAALAEVLAEDDAVPPARLADHWQAAERWAEAGEACFQAGLAAHRTGRLADHSDLLLRSADLFGRAGRHGRRIDALSQRLDGELVRVGGQVVVDQVAELLAQPLAAAQRAELLQLECEALLNLTKWEQVLQRMPQLLQACEPFPSLVPDALCLSGRALAEQGRMDEARPVLQRAVALAEALHCNGGSPAPLARALGHHAYACYRQADRLSEGVQLLQRAAQMALDLGDPADHAIHCTNLATFHHQLGDPAATLESALQTQQSFHRLHASNGHTAAINDLNLAAGALCTGRLGLALQTLESARARLGHGAPAAAIAKARVQQAELWLLLGQPALALDLLLPATDWPAEAPTIFQGMRHFALARARQALGLGDAAGDWARGEDCARRLPDFSLSPALLRDWAERAPATAVADQLQRLSASAERTGAHGLLRSLRLLSLRLRLREGDPHRCTHDLACQALDDAHLPHHAATPPLQIYNHLSLAFDTLGDPARSQQCRALAVRWAQQAATDLPDHLKGPFLAAVAGQGRLR